MRLVLFSLISGAIAFGGWLGQSAADTRKPAQAEPLPHGGPSSEDRFTTLDIAVDPAGRPLAAYQIDFKARDHRVKIVGIEGGEHSAFAQPPYYDPAAMQGERVIAAAFSLNPELPAHSTRIITLHLLIPAGAAEDYDVTLTTAADPSGQKIPATVSIVKGIQQ